MPDYGKSDEEYRREYNKPAKEPSPKAQHSSHKKPHPSRVESSSPMPTDPGGDMVVRLASMLPYLALAVVTGQHQASHSIMQSRRRR
jgi:hypothetical protein